MIKYSTPNKPSELREDFKEFYSKYPDMFISDWLDVKLKPYQRLLIRKMCGSNNK